MVEYQDDILLNMKVELSDIMSKDAYDFHVYINPDEGDEKKPHDVFLKYSDIQQIEEWSKKQSDSKKSVVVHSGPKAAFCSTIIRETGKWKNVIYTK